jgi:hypothetical protein
MVCSVDAPVSNKYTRSFIPCDKREGPTFAKIDVYGAKLGQIVCYTPISIKKFHMQNEIPTWVIWAVGLSSAIQVISGIFVVIITAILAFVFLQIRGDMAEIVKNLNATSKNVEKISTDAADTTHNVTGAVNRVSNLVGSAANRMESPVIRAVGLASGLVAASRSMRGKKKTVVVEKKKGLFG